MLHRFSTDTAIDPAAPVIVRGEEFHHAVRVRRVRVGELVEIFDPFGLSFEAVVEEIGNRELVLRISRQVPSRESSLHLTLAISLIHPDKFELVLQKATELGVSRIVPVISERVEVRLERVEKKFERWERIIAEAVKQCGRSSSPTLARPVPFAEILSCSHSRFILDADAPESTPGLVTDEVTMLIGPEGGFSNGEITMALEAGFLGLRLGPRRLRAETAAIAAVVVAQTRWGDGGGRNDEG